MAKDEAEKQKSLALAELAGWEYTTHPYEDSCRYGWWAKDALGFILYPNPYAGTIQGYAQFTAILLKFPDVITMFVQVEGCGNEQCCGEVGLYAKPT